MIGKANEKSEIDIYDLPDEIIDNQHSIPSNLVKQTTAAFGQDK